MFVSQYFYTIGLIILVAVISIVWQCWNPFFQKLWIL